MVPPNCDSDDARQAVEGTSAWRRITDAVVSRSAARGIARQSAAARGYCGKSKEKGAAHCGPRRKANRR